MERVIDAHPDVVESAVVGQAHPKWGEVPVAFVTTSAGADLAPDEVIAFARERLAGFKVPRVATFAELPKTPTGKIQKMALRSQLDENDRRSDDPA